MSKLHLADRVNEVEFRAECKRCGDLITGADRWTTDAETFLRDPDGCKQWRLETVEAVNHPQHYGGADNPYETIKVIEAWKLDFCLGNAVKYISRAGKKDPTKELEDLEKAAFYLNRRIGQLKK